LRNTAFTPISAARFASCEAAVAAHHDDRYCRPNSPDFARELGAHEIRHLRAVGFESSSAALQAFQRHAAPIRCRLRMSRCRISWAPSSRAKSGEFGRHTDLVMSGYGGSQLANRAAEIGVNAVLRKPCTAATWPSRWHACWDPSIDAFGVCIMRDTNNHAGDHNHAGGPSSLTFWSSTTTLRSARYCRNISRKTRCGSVSRRPAKQMTQILAEEPVDSHHSRFAPCGEDGMAIVRSFAGSIGIPVVMLTGVRDEADRVMGLELGADDYLTKTIQSTANCSRA